MPASTTNPLLEPFMATAEAAAHARPAVDPDVIREIFDEAATLLHNGLVLDGLDEQDTEAAVAGLCVALVADDPGAALRDLAEVTREGPGGLHDPEGVSAAYLMAAGILMV
jgi:hypothetical protein